MKYISLLFLFNLSFLAFTQNKDTTAITITGQVTAPGNDFYNLLIVNQRTHIGIFGDQLGNFTISAQKSDTIVIGSLGYMTKKICYHDSLYQPAYTVTVALSKPLYNLQEVKVFPRRELEEIYEDIDKLGFKKSEYMLSPVDALNSPITFLWQAFSKRARSERKYHELVNEDKRRALLKELLEKYTKTKFIDLKDNEFDKFIDYCNVSDAFLQNTSQYDFIVFIKRKHESYLDEYGW